MRPGARPGTRSTWTKPSGRFPPVGRRPVFHTESLCPLGRWWSWPMPESRAVAKALIFPSRRGGKVIHLGTLSKLFLELKIPGVPHGLRVTFMNWAVERAHISEPVAELELAHQPSSVVVRSFLHERLFRASPWRSCSSGRNSSLRRWNRWRRPIWTNGRHLPWLSAPGARLAHEDGPIGRPTIR